MAEQSSLAQAQREFTAHIRDPATVAAPSGIESRRMKIYNDLIYNNIEGFLSGGFPVTRSLYRDEDWHRLVRSFVRERRCETPYFLEISQEFIEYLMQEYQANPVDPPFLLELVHYEWAELALDVDVEELPEPSGADPVDGCPSLSPLAWNLAYQYPVHLIGPGVEPDQPPAEPTYLVVYRNRDDEVGFLELNAATARLLELVRESEGQRLGSELLTQLADEMNAESVTPVLSFGATMLRQLVEQSIILAEPA